MQAVAVVLCSQAVWTGEYFLPFYRREAKDEAMRLSFPPTVFGRCALLSQEEKRLEEQILSEHFADSSRLQQSDTMSQTVWSIGAQPVAGLAHEANVLQGGGAARLGVSIDDTSDVKPPAWRCPRRPTGRAANDSIAKT